MYKKTFLCEAGNEVVMRDQIRKRMIVSVSLSYLFFGMMFSVNASEYIYTVSNSTNGNSVIGYEVGQNGVLTELLDSPYLTGGVGTDEPSFSDHGIISDKAGRFLFVTNPQSGDISVFRVRRNGSLNLVNGSPFSTGGVAPTSLSLSDDILYISHIGAAIAGTSCVECDYRGFRVGRRGRLTPIKGSLVSLENPTSAIPFSILFNQEGDTLIGSRLTPAPLSVDDHIIEAFKLDKKTGLLISAPGAPYLAQGPQSLGMVFNPTNDTQLFVSALVEFLVQPGSVSSYLVAETGQISPITSIGVGTDGQFSTCWLDVTSNGNYLFASNTRSGSISRYSVAEDAQLILLGNSQLPLLQDSNLDTPLQVTITTDDRYLYTVTEDANLIGWSHNNGNLTLLPQGPIELQNVEHPYGLALVTKRARRY